VAADTEVEQRRGAPKTGPRIFAAIGLDGRGKTLAGVAVAAIAKVLDEMNQRHGRRCAGCRTRTDVPCKHVC
jgi:xanthine/CO dehydrogenase XdhC/CoxF family maturation factor